MDASRPESTSLTQDSIERAARDRQAHDPKPSSRRFRRADRLLACHQGAEGAPPRQEEGEEHQAQQVGPSR